MTISAPTTIDATSGTPGCPTISIQGMTLDLNADLTIAVDSITAVNGLHVISADGQPHSLTIVATGDPDGIGGTVNLGASTVVAPGDLGNGVRDRHPHGRHRDPPPRLRTVRFPLRMGHGEHRILNS
ncbi:hypothetical protein QT381_11635 [Galbitalea sp. SE-J8]|uniref:hypothetical protein n=1 Tax=Galbitalea sp. SE-J8 TaxID=3054952 RepID=UPI00259CCEE4|nr:hypothetical protein [Galbitalea sp. SE-J8]MDM4763659.1 hypothetical protein [Galbitalea sp. SE-J8]